MLLGPRSWLPRECVFILFFIIITINCIYEAPVSVLKTSFKQSTASHQTHNT